MDGVERIPKKSDKDVEKNQMEAVIFSRTISFIVRFLL